jgi:hypothetical protein
MRPGAQNSRPISPLARFLLLASAAIALASCETFERAGERAPERAVSDPGIVAIRAKLVEGASRLVGKTELVIKGRRFNWDCTGTVLAVYWYAGIDLSRDFDKYGGNGVSRLFRSLESRDLLYDTEYPLPGDLVFWDDTYDANGDGEWNDELTHVGMAVETDGDGNVSFVHLNAHKGIVVERMNLREPDSRGKNAPMRLARPGVRHPARWLAGQLYRMMGMGYLFEQ